LAVSNGITTQAGLDFVESIARFGVALSESEKFRDPPDGETKARILSCAYGQIKHP
jgi:hypothetical protein